MNSRRDRVIAFFMLLPSLILLAIFVYYFIGRAVQTSMTDWGTNPNVPPLSENVQRTFVGMENYENLMTNLLEFSFRTSMVNTFFFTIFFVGGCIVIGLTLAMLLDQPIVGEGIFRTIFLFPMALSFVVTGTIWRWMLQPGGGINILPEKLLGLDPIEFRWLSSRETWFQFEWADVPNYLSLIGMAILLFLAARYFFRGRQRANIIALVIAALLLVAALTDFWDFLWPALDDPLAERSIAPKGFNAALIGVILAAVWQMSGYTMAMFIAGIRGVSEDLREAARVDGCSELEVYRYIILPQLSPIVLSAMIILGHISLKIFDLVFAMAGPDNAQTVVPGILVYVEGFRANNFATAAAVAVIMLFFVALIIIPYLWSQLRASRR